MRLASRLHPWCAAAAAAIVGVLAPLPTFAGPRLEESPDVEDLIRLRLAEGEDYRILRLSGAAYYVQFASSEVRSAVFEGIPLESLGASASRLTLTVPGDRLAAAYGRAPTLGGAGGAFRDALVAAKFFPVAAGSPRPVLITLIETSDPGRLYDFSVSESFEQVTARDEGLRRLEGTTAGETRSLTRFEENHPIQATWELWRFDELPDLLDAAESRERREERLLEARRARFLAETIRALYWADPGYEDAILAWVEGELDRAEVNLLAQLLQIAGVDPISPETLVRESAPHLFDPDVLTWRLFRRLEGLTRPVGKKGRRELDPAQFASAEILDRAAGFYAGFFVADDRGRFEFLLRDDVAAFVDRQSVEVRQISRPFLARLLSDLPASSTAGTPEPSLWR